MSNGVWEEMGRYPSAVAAARANQRWHEQGYNWQIETRVRLVTE